MRIEKLIDRLLASPHYGEQWGRHWLDVVRFGESRGFERNEIIDNAWPFRDYVIRSLNEDKPFDVLVREHLAGDVIGKDQPGVEVGVTFLVGGPYDDVGNQDAAQAAQIRANTIDEMIRATAEAFLGLTVGCARCHDHKFDPVLQRDYYGLYATFAGVYHGSRAVATAEQRQARDEALRPLNENRDRLTKQLAALDAAIDKLSQQQADLNRQLAEVNRQINAVPPLPTWWVGEFKPITDKFQVFLGGDPQRRGAEVVPASLSALDAVAPPYRLSDDAAEGQRRLQLAEWITYPDNPLTPRVLANRIWHYHFGTGIVETPSDFGYMGGRPTHPELLDWLARQIQQHGWRLKPLHRQILLSETYRQSSAFRADAAAVDADSRYLWRFPPRRLAAEEIRDTMLSVAGKLDPKMGGPGFRLYRYLQDNVSTYIPLDEHGPETYRRAVYHQNARAFPAGSPDRIRLPRQFLFRAAASIDDHAAASLDAVESSILDRHGERPCGTVETGGGRGPNRGAGPAGVCFGLFAGAHGGRACRRRRLDRQARPAGLLPGGAELERNDLPAVDTLVITCAVPSIHLRLTASRRRRRFETQAPSACRYTS